MSWLVGSALKATELIRKINSEGAIEEKEDALNRRMDLLEHKLQHMAETAVRSGSRVGNLRKEVNARVEQAETSFKAQLSAFAKTYEADVAKAAQDIDHRRSYPEREIAREAAYNMVARTLEKTCKEHTTRADFTNLAIRVARLEERDPCRDMGRSSQETPVQDAEQQARSSEAVTVGVEARVHTLETAEYDDEGEEGSDMENRFVYPRVRRSS